MSGRLIAWKHGALDRHAGRPLQLAPSQLRCSGRSETQIDSSDSSRSAVHARNPLAGAARVPVRDVARVRPQLLAAAATPPCDACSVQESLLMRNELQIIEIRPAERDDTLKPMQPSCLPSLRTPRCPGGRISATLTPTHGVVISKKRFLVISSLGGARALKARV